RCNPLIYFAVATVLELVFGILASIITMTREPHGDNARQNTKHQFQNRCNPLIYFAVATVLELVFGILASIIT
ncbi:hypothetical protein PSY19_24390, partial [Shigella flexneri]|nr:hypothetical protein [Shigella flexneri]